MCDEPTCPDRRSWVTVDQDYYKYLLERIEHLEDAVRQYAPHACGDLEIKA